MRKTSSVADTAIWAKKNWRKIQKNWRVEFSHVYLGGEGDDSDDYI